MLSALHALNRPGYAVVFAMLAGAGFFWRRKIASGDERFPSWLKLKRRFRRFFPSAFLVLAALAILGGLLHPPNNYDALAYRVPRMLHWLAEGHWHWVHTDFPRLNTRSCGVEWVLTPMIAFLRTDRWLFVVNGVSFLLLPGLIYSVFTQVGVKRRVAWHWMWLLPSGYCFLLQAGSIANDLFGAIFALAALDFALRAGRLNRAADAWLSLMAAALFTGAKTSNLPLLLPWLVAFLPTWRLWLPARSTLLQPGGLARPLAFLAGIPLAIGASFIPMAVLNWRYCGDWTGMAAEGVEIGLGPRWLYLLNNTVNLSLQNLSPPIFPFASQWNQMAPSLIPAWLRPMLERYCEPDAAHWGLGEMQTEEIAGLGFGVTFLLGLSLLAIAVRRRHFSRKGSDSPRLSIPGLVCAAAWVSFSYVMTKIGLSGVSRFFTPYFLLITMGLLRNDMHDALVRTKWWRTAALAVFAMAAVLVVASNARPLWPSAWVFRRYPTFFEQSPMGQRIRTVYSVYGQRHDAFAPMREALPTDATVVGLITYDDLETSFWRPFGSRRILHVKVSDSGNETRRRGIRYVFVKPELLKESWEHWLQRMNARELWSGKLQYRAAFPAIPWRLASLNSEAGDQELKVSPPTGPFRTNRPAANP